MRTRFISILLVVPVIAALVGAGAAQASSPPDVENVMASIASNLQSYKWKVVGNNIEDLDNTIRQNLRVNGVAVQITDNPVAAKLDQLTRAGAVLASERKALRAAITKLDKQETKVQTAATIAIIEAMKDKLELISPQPDLQDLFDHVDAESAEELLTTLDTLTTLRAQRSFLKKKLHRTEKAWQAIQDARIKVLRLDRKMSAVLAKYSITVGGPAVQPNAPSNPSQHPRVAGVWVDGPGSCAGQITFTQDGNGAVTGASMTSCEAAWVGSAFTWQSQYVLTYNYSFTRRPAGWRDGTHVVTFSPDGQSASLEWTDGPNSGSGTLTRVS